MEQQFIFHIGFPKSGSTLLQKKFFPQFENYEGVSRLTNEFMVELFKHEPNSIILDEKIKQFQKNSRDPNCFFSEELFLLPWLRDEELKVRVFKNFQNWGLDVPKYDLDWEVTVRNLKNILPDSRIILIIRNQYDILLSEFTHRYRENVPSWSKISSIQKYIQTTWEAKLYDRLIDQLFSDFGRDNVLVLPFEMMIKDTAEFNEKLKNFLDLEEMIPLKVGEKVNEGEYGMARAYRKKMKKRIASLKEKKFAFSKKASEFLYFRILDKPWFLKLVCLPIASIYGKKELCIPANLKDQLSEAYIESNIKTSKLIGVDLGKYGYPIKGVNQ